MLTLRGSLRARAVAVGLVLIGAVYASPLAARSSADSPYTLGQTYNAALRLLRVDLGLKVLEHDPAAGYLMFEYRSSESGTRTVPGSLEIVESGKVVRVVVQLSQMPRYHEQVMLDALSRKLRDEYGEPPRAADRTAPDGGAGAADDK